MNTIFTDLITYSADKRYKFEKGNNEFYLIAVLPDNGNIKVEISVTKTYKADGVHVFVQLIGYDSKREYVVIIDNSKVNSAEKIYKLIEKRLETNKPAINEKIIVLQKSFDYHAKAIDFNKFFENIKGVDMNYTSNKIKGYYNQYTCTFESEKDSQLASLTFNANKENIAKIMQCLIDNGLLEPVK